MKPTFALNLTEDGIGLLHRTSKGWQPVGEASFASPDLPDALGYMRKTALGLAPRGISTKLVLPNSQVLYTEVEAPGPDAESRKLQIRAALEGRTPYDVNDLAFDWRGNGRHVQVAVVAKETLAEAEGFAVEHRFNPISFVAMPDADVFPGEPFFGPTAFAATFLPEGEKVDRDKEAITVLNRDLAKAEPSRSSDVAPAPMPEPERVPQVTLAEDVAEVAQTPPAEPERPEAAEATPEPVPTPAPLPEMQPNPQPEQVAAPSSPIDTPAFTAPSPAVAETDLTAEPDGWLEPTKPAARAPTVRPDAVVAAPEPAAKAAIPTVETAGPVAFTVNEDLDEAPFTHVLDQTPFPEVEDGPAPLPGLGAPDADADDIPPAPSATMRVAFASRRAAGDPSLASGAPNIAATNVGGSAPMLGAAPSRTPQSVSTIEAVLARNARGKPIEELPPMPRPAQAAAKPSVATKARDGVAKGLGALVKSTDSKKRKPVPDAKPEAKAEVKAAPMTMATKKPLVKPGGTFGDAPIRKGKPRYLGLILTGLLLVFLALVAAWSSLYLAQSNTAPDTNAVASATGPAIVEVPAEAAANDDTPAVDDEMLADAQDPDAFADASVEVPSVVPNAPDATNLAADLATGSVLEAATADQTPAEPAAMAQAPAPAPDAAIATDSPSSSSLTEDQDEIFLAAMDAPPPALDALALPTPENQGDPPPGALPPPPPFGTVYQFDENGLIRPTPEGILTPEGVMLIAGAPPIKPPSRSETVLAAAAAAAPLPDGPTVEAEPFDSAAVATDPTTTVEAGTKAAADNVADPAMAGFRPKQRPEGLKPATEEDATAPAATDGIAVTSLRPLARPKTVLAAGEQARRETEAASLAAAAEEKAAAEQVASNDPNNPSLLAISRRPAERPRDMSRAVEAAVAAAIRAPEPKAEPEPEAVVEPVVAAKPTAKEPAPKVIEPEAEEEPEVASNAKHAPLKGTVAKKATFVNALNLSKMNLIGVYGTQSKRYALVRQPSGRYKKVRVGDSIDGGKVAAITTTEVRYQKGGRMIALKMPKG